MCGTCGCADEASITIDGEGGEHVHVLADGSTVRHRHEAAGHAHGEADGSTATHQHEGAEHVHVLADGSTVRHRHVHALADGSTVQHQHEAAEHVHVLADGSTVRHRHDDGHSHAHVTDEAHEHLLPDGRVIRHSHEGGGQPHPAHGVVTGHHAAASHTHPLADGSTVTHHHGHDGLHPTEARRIAVEQDVMAKNDRAASLNRTRFEATGTFVLNLMSSPGSGKTTLLVRTLDALKAGGKPLMVIEGDQQTSLDAERIRATGVTAVQVNTGKGCHLDAEMVMRALARKPAPAQGLLFVENVGNLVCPAGFDLGEAKKVVIASVTEGEEKPLKYPDMFAVADLVLLNKVDLVAALEFDLAALERNVRKVNPRAKVLHVSARTGQGFDAWLSWLAEQSAARPATAAPRSAEVQVR
ncbi:MAG: hydrogenase nickel incorporation protein HypB [Myxococcaceae bacterium]|nr:hydrogenase nickel incorporation protein HypB [Myxococcaceae bacterium]